MREYDWHGSSPRNTVHVVGSSKTSSKEAKANALKAAADYVSRRPELGPLHGWSFTPAAYNNGRPTTKRPLANPLEPRKRGHRFCRACGGERPGRSWDGTFAMCRCAGH